MEILFEDNDIIIIVKPVGILSQGDGKKSESVVDFLREHLRQRGENGDIYVVHRLDKAVGGLMIYAKNANSAAKLSSQIQSGEMIKEYLAVVHSKPEDKSGYMEDLLFKDSSRNKSFVVKRERKGVKKAKLYYEVIKTEDTKFGEASLVKIRLFTGRTHQIRVQFSSRKMPLIGDGKYGASDNTDIALRSYKITFRHPSTDLITFFEKPYEFSDVFGS